MWENVMALSDVIKEARISKNLKQEDVAKSLSVTVQTYSKWENGKTEPKASQVSPLAELLGLTEQEICKGELNEKYELIDFMGESSRYIKHVTEFDMAKALWKVLDNDKEFLQILKEVASKSPSYQVAQQMMSSDDFTSNEERVAEMQWESTEQKENI